MFIREERVRQLEAQARKLANARGTSLPVWLRTMLASFRNGEVGLMGMQLLSGLLGVVIIMLVMSYAVPVLWPLVVTASANVTAMSGSDGGTTIMKALWPVALLMVGLGVGIGLIIFALRQLDVF